MSSKFEGFGMVLIEALRNGVPCISYDCPAGPSDIIKTEYNGLLIPNQDEKLMELAMKRLIQDSDLRMRMGKVAPESINEFDSMIVAGTWIDYLKAME